ncbi:protein kinase [Streptomyces sp. NA02950]|uniref:protein kinase domain-containing protein n=1 Tax=Streptomyces sp. NA02950 TaxID=2742137 RepID=UPI0034CE6C20
MALAVLPPEQRAGGRPRPLGDVFPLGAVLAYAVTGRLGPDVGTLPGELRGTLGTCLAPDPADRPTAQALLEELARRGRLPPPVNTPPLPSGPDTADIGVPAAAAAGGMPPSGWSATVRDSGGVSPAAALLGPGWLPGRVIAALSEQSSAVLDAEVESAPEPSPEPADGRASRRDDEELSPSIGPSRRGLLVGAVGGTAGVAVGAGVTWTATAPDDPPPPTPAERLAAAHRSHRRLEGAPPQPRWRHDVTGAAPAYAPLIWRDQAVDRYGPLDEPTLRAVGAVLVRTLMDVHGAGLVHRDLKPSNIVLTSRGPRIIDFGIARPEHGLTLTTTGQSLATPGYAAPEQVLGRRTGPAGDVFSLGVVLAYAAGGRPVYAGGHVAAVQYQVVHGEPDLDAVPQAIRAWVRPCLDKEPGRRPALDAVARGLTPPRGADRAWRTGPLAEDIARREADARRLATLPGDEVSGPSRRRLIGGLAAGGAVLVAGGGAGAWWLLRDDDSHAETRPWAAKPLAHYEEGNAPTPLWGPMDTGVSDPGDEITPLPVHDLVVVAATGRRLRAYGVRDGAQRWTSTVAGLTGRPLVLSDDTVLIAESRGAVRALGAADGKERWAASRADAATPLAVDDTAVYLATRTGRLRAVSLSSRSTLWTGPLAGEAERRTRGGGRGQGAPAGPRLRRPGRRPRHPEREDGMGSQETRIHRRGPACRWRHRLPGREGPHRAHARDR